MVVAVSEVIVTADAGAVAGAGAGAATTRRVADGKDGRRAARAMGPSSRLRVGPGPSSRSGRQEAVRVQKAAAAAGNNSSSSSRQKEGCSCSSTGSPSVGWASRPKSTPRTQRGGLAGA